MTEFELKKTLGQEIEIPSEVETRIQTACARAGSAPRAVRRSRRPLRTVLVGGRDRRPRHQRGGSLLHCAGRSADGHWSSLRGIFLEMRAAPRWKVPPFMMNLEN